MAAQQDREKQQQQQQHAASLLYVCFVAHHFFRFFLLLLLPLPNPPPSPPPVFSLSMFSLGGSSTAHTKRRRQAMQYLGTMLVSIHPHETVPEASQSLIDSAAGQMSSRKAGAGALKAKPFWLSAAEASRSKRLVSRTGERPCVIPDITAPSSYRFKTGSSGTMDDASPPPAFLSLSVCVCVCVLPLSVCVLFWP